MARHRQLGIEEYGEAFCSLKYTGPGTGSRLLAYRHWPMLGSPNLDGTTPIRSLSSLSSTTEVLPEEPLLIPGLAISPFLILSPEHFSHTFPVPSDLRLYGGMAPPSVQKYLVEQLYHSGHPAGTSLRRQWASATLSFSGLPSPLKLKIVQFVAHSDDGGRSLFALSEVSVFWRELTKPSLRRIQAEKRFGTTFSVPAGDDTCPLTPLLSLENELTMAIDGTPCPTPLPTSSPVSPPPSSSSSLGFRSFPQELIDLIIDQLSPELDADTLQSCSLVSKAWVARSQLHLFRTMYIDAAHCPRLLCWFLTRHKNHRAHIHRLVFSAECLLDEFIDAAIGLLSLCRITHLTIVQRRAFELPYPWPNSLRSIFSDFFQKNVSSLTTVALYGLSYFPFRLLRSVTALRHLLWHGSPGSYVHGHLPAVGPLSTADSSLSQAPVSISIASASFSTSSATDTLLNSGIDLAQLHKLEVVVQKPAYFFLESRVFAECARGLKQLKVSVSLPALAELWTSHGPAVSGSPLSLSRLTAIEKLEIHSEWHTSLPVVSSATWYPSCRLGACFAALIDSLPEDCPTLTELTLSLCLRRGKCDKNLEPWRAVDATISSSGEVRFPSLELVAIRVCVECWSVSVRDANDHMSLLRDAFARLEAGVGGRKLLFELEACGANE